MRDAWSWLDGKRTMKIVMTLLVRDEQDILAENIEYHRSQGVDFFIIMDNLSVDATPEIAKRYVHQGIASYILQEEDDYSQSKWVTMMARMAFRDFGADWVINNDADEFWWPKSGSLGQVFAALGPGYNAVLANRHNFVLVRTDKTVPFYDSMVYREAVSRNPLGNPLPPKMAHRGNAEVVVAQGNHTVTGLEKLSVVTDVIEIFHFPLRSVSQFENKIAKGGAAYARNTTLPQTTGITWRKLYEEYSEQQGLAEYFEQNLYDADRLERELAVGKLIEDRRLAEFFHNSL